MIRVALLLSVAVPLSYCVPSAAMMIERVTTSACSIYQQYDESSTFELTKSKAEIVGAEKVLSKLAHSCEQNFSSLKIGSLLSECVPSYNRNSRLLCVTCLTVVGATCD